MGVEVFTLVLTRAGVAVKDEGKSTEGFGEADFSMLGLVDVTGLAFDPPTLVAEAGPA